LSVIAYVVLGSEVGSVMFLVYIADLKALDKEDSLIKSVYCTLVVPAVSIC